MSLYYYRAVSNDGEQSDGQLECDNRDALISHLHSRGLLLIDAWQDSKLASIKRRKLFSLLLKTKTDTAPLKYAEVVRFTAKFASLLQSGLELKKVLELQSSSPIVGELSQRLLEQLRSGVSLSDALQQEPSFDDFYISMVRAGEKSGSLSETMQQLAKMMQDSYRLRVEVRQALIYPGILTIAVVLAFILLSVIVIPQFEPIFLSAGAQQPIMAQILLGLSKIVSFTLPWIILTGLLSFLWVRYKLKSKSFRVKFSAVFYRVPIIGDILLHIALARFFLTLAILVRQGVALLDGMKLLTQGIQNTSLRLSFEQMREHIGQGISMAKAIRKDERIPSVISDLVQAGEATGKLDKMLFEASRILNEDTKDKLEKFVSWLNPMIVIIFSIFIAFMMIALMSSVISVYDITL